MTDSPTRPADARDEEGGEVAVRERGQVTAIDCSRLDGQISICLDGEDPEVGVPPHADVRFEDPTAAADEILADGGVADHVRITPRGAGLGEDLALWAVFGAMGVLVAGGYLLSTVHTLPGLICLAVGGLLTAILAQQREESVA